MGDPRWHRAICCWSAVAGAGSEEPGGSVSLADRVPRWRTPLAMPTAAGHAGSDGSVTAEAESTVPPVSRRPTRRAFSASLSGRGRAGRRLIGDKPFPLTRAVLPCCRTLRGFGSSPSTHGKRDPGLPRGHPGVALGWTRRKHA